MRVRTEQRNGFALRLAIEIRMGLECQTINGANGAAGEAGRSSEGYFIVSERRPVVLFATPVLHHPPYGGPTLRIENSIKALSQCAELHICSRVSLDEIGGMQAQRFYEGYACGFHFVGHRPSMGRYVLLIKRLVNGASWRILGRLTYEMGPPVVEDYGSIVKLAESINADVIWLGYGNISYPLLKFLKDRSHLPVVLDTDSVWSRFVLRGLEYASTEGERGTIQRRGNEKAEEERWGTAIADVTAAVSEVDADYYRALSKNPTQVQIFQNVIDVDSYRSPPPPAAGLKKPCVILAGSFWANSPMHDAARWIIDGVLPTLKRTIPNIHLYIVGNRSDVVLADVVDEAVTVTGRVESVLPYLCHSAVALVPLRFESGTRFKILEAGACGIPVVSTTLGAEGLPVTHDQNILIADNHDDFAKCVAQLIMDPQKARTLGNNLKAFVQANFSIDSLAQAARHILQITGQCQRPL